MTSNVLFWFPQGFCHCCDPCPRSPCLMLFTCAPSGDLVAPKAFHLSMCEWGRAAVPRMVPHCQMQIRPMQHSAFCSWQKCSFINVVIIVEVWNGQTQNVLYVLVNLSLSRHLRGRFFFSSVFSQTPPSDFRAVKAEKLCAMFPWRLQPQTEQTESEPE